MGLRCQVEELQWRCMMTARPTCRGWTTSHPGATMARVVAKPRELVNACACRTEGIVVQIHISAGTRHLEVYWYELNYGASDGGPHGIVLEMHSQRVIG